MVQSVGSRFFNSILMYRMQETNSEINKTQLQASTGKVAQKYSEYGSHAKPVIEMTHQRECMRKYIADNKYMIGCQDNMESAIKGLINIATDLRTHLVSLRSSTLPEPSTFVASIKNGLRNIEATINRTDNNGAYLFSGTSNLPPVDLSDMPVVSSNSGPITECYYKGNNEKQEVFVAETLLTSYSINADESGIEKLIRSISMALDPSIVGHNPNLLEQSMRLSEESIAELTEILSRIGKNQKYMMDINEKIKDDLAVLEQSLSVLEDVDLPEALTNLTRQQTQLSALFMSITSHKSSLMDFMR